VIEPVDGTLKVHDAPLGIMTNAPTYDWHMTNLQNYINLSVKDVEGTKLGPVSLPAFGSGSGLHGMPGDFTPPSRFVRAAIYAQSAAPNATAEDAVLSAFHILNQFDIPKGSVQNSAIGGTVDEITEWTSVADLKNLRWYFTTHEDQSIHMVDLKEAVDAAKGEVRTHRDGRLDGSHHQRLDEFHRREVGCQTAQSASGSEPAGRLLVSNLRADHPPAAEEATPPNAARVERRCPTRSIGR